MTRNSIRAACSTATLCLAAAGLLDSCAGCQRPPPSPPPPYEGPDAADDCARACANMRSAELRCPEADDADGGDSCEVACRHAQEGGLTDLRPRCLAAAKTVDELRACGSVKCRR